MRELLPRVARVPEEIFFSKIQENGAAKHINLYLEKKKLWYGHGMPQETGYKSLSTNLKCAYIMTAFFLGMENSLTILALQLSLSA